MLIVQIYRRRKINIALSLRSILLSDCPMVKSEWNNPELEEEFSQILKVREIVTKALGEKCECCWKYRPIGVKEGYETICEDCYNAITEQD